MKLIPIAAFPEKNIVAPAQIDFDTFVKVKKLPKLIWTPFKSKNLAEIACRGGGRVIWAIKKGKGIFSGKVPRYGLEDPLGSNTIPCGLQ